MSPRLVDYTSRDPEDLVEMFNFWGRVDAPSVGGKLYAELGFEIARDPELLSLAAESQVNQPPPNMLFAAVQYLLLLDTEKRGLAPLPELPDSIEVAWRMGVDLHPVDITDDDQVRWLRALIFPEHVERHAQMAAAIRIGRAHPPQLVEGDAVERLPELLEQAPRDAALVVFATHALYQFPKKALRGLFKTLVSHGERRPLFFLSMEGTGIGCSELQLTRYVAGERDTVKLADCNPHGLWIEWGDS